MTGYSGPCCATQCPLGLLLHMGGLAGAMHVPRYPSHCLTPASVSSRSRLTLGLQHQPPAWSLCLLPLYGCGFSFCHSAPTPKSTARCRCCPCPLGYASPGGLGPSCSLALSRLLPQISRVMHDSPCFGQDRRLHGTEHRGGPATWLENLCCSSGAEGAQGLWKEKGPQLRSCPPPLPVLILIEWELSHTDPD